MRAENISYEPVDRAPENIHLETNAKAALGLILGATLMLAFSMRLGVRLAFGEDYFWSNSYFDYYRLAQDIISGN